MTNTFGNMILVYRVEDGRGIPEATIEGPWPDGTEALYTGLGKSWVVMERATATDVWVDLSGETPVGCMREDGPWSVNGSVFAAGEDTGLVVSGLPPGSTVTFGLETYTVDDGTFEFISATPGSFTYTVRCWPYFDFNSQVTFT